MLRAVGRIGNETVKGALMKGQRSQGWVSQNCLWEAAFGEVWDTEVLSGGADV